MPAEAPLFLMYTSGTTGKPKGCQHSTGGYLAYVAGTSKYVQDIHPEDVYWCMADIGWITGHSYIVYGPLALCASTVIFEGVPTFPDAGRAWKIAQDLNVNIFHTAPTTIRALRKIGPNEPAKYNFNFKHMTTVGEPIEPEVWRWYHDVVGKGKAAIVDTWWQTETGGFLCSTLPAIKPDEGRQCRPGGAGHPPHHLRRKRPRRSRAGPARPATSAFRTPGRAAFQTIWGDRDRFVRTYYRALLQEPQEQGLARLALPDRGCGRRGPGRVLPHPGPDRRRHQRFRPPPGDQGDRVRGDDGGGGRRGRRGAGEARDQGHRAGPLHRAQTRLSKPSPELEKKISDAICREIGKIAKPRRVWIVRDMPKTRSGKIMRRVLGAISNKKDVGDVTTLANPEIVEEIRKMAK